MAVLLALGGLGFNGVSRSMEVSGAVDTVWTLLQEARLEAMSTGLGSRLVIDNGIDPEHKLSRMAIFRAEVDSGSGVVRWKLTGRPFYLADGVYFLPDDSTGQTDGLSYDFRSADFQDGDTGTTVLVYEVDGSGFVNTTSFPSDGARLVFGRGIIEESTANLEVPEPLKPLRQGLLLRKSARPVYLESISP